MYGSTVCKIDSMLVDPLAFRMWTSWPCKPGQLQVFLYAFSTDFIWCFEALSLYRGEYCERISVWLSTKNNLCHPFRKNIKPSMKACVTYCNLVLEYLGARGNTVMVYTEKTPEPFYYAIWSAPISMSNGRCSSSAFAKVKLNISMKRRWLNTKGMLPPLFI